MINTADKSKIIISLCLILVIVFIAFLPSLKNRFVNWDDIYYVTENLVIQHLSWDNLGSIFTKFFLGHYHPITILSYLFEYQFFKLNPFVYHLTNLILHLLNSIFVFWLIYLFTCRVSISFITAILFGIHPLHVESVVWISERKDVLYAFFFLGAMICYLYYLRQKKVSKYYYFSLFLFIFSLLSKSMAVTLPLALLTLDYLMYRKIEKSIFIEKIAYFALSLIFGITAIFGAHISGVIRQEGIYSLLDRLLIASYGIVFYLNKIFLPTRLSALYPYYGIKNMSIYMLYIFVTMVVLLIGIFMSRRYTRKIVFGSSLFLVTILPALQFIPNGEIIVADRYVYLASLGIFYIFAEGVIWLDKRKIKHFRAKRSVILIASVIIASILFSFTWKRCQVWRDSISLWSDVINNYPSVATAYTLRGVAYRKNGNIDLAISDYNKAITIDPYYVEAYNNRGNIYLAIGNFHQSTLDYNKAIEIDRFNSITYYNRGSAYQLSGNLTQAISDYNKAIEINPDYAVAYNNRAIVYFGKHEFDKSWKDVYKAESLGYEVAPAFLEKLKKESKRER